MLGSMRILVVCHSDQKRGRSDDSAFARITSPKKSRGSCESIVVCSFLFPQISRHLPRFLILHTQFPPPSATKVPSHRKISSKLPTPAHHGGNQDRCPTRSLYLAHTYASGFSTSLHSSCTVVFLVSMTMVHRDGTSSMSSATNPRPSPQPQSASPSVTGSLHVCR